jgi:hypothetical protein
MGFCLEILFWIDVLCPYAIPIFLIFWSWDSAVGIATGYGLDG